MFIILVMILILIGMLALCDSVWRGWSVPVHRRTARSTAFKQVQTAGTRLTTTVQAMLSPSAPQESAPGSSPESASVGADVPVQCKQPLDSPPLVGGKARVWVGNPTASCG